jgi:hypothetical protein
MRILKLLTLLFPAIVVMPAASGVLYKSVDSNGSIVFSDVPPAGAKLLDQRRLPDYGMGASNASARTAGMPLYEFPEYDADLARANERVDLAEHALALARQGLWSTRDGLQLAASRMTPADEARVEHFKKGVKIARQELLNLLRERQVTSAGRFRLASR